MKTWLWSCSHDHRLVVLSVLISILAAYAARDLSERVSDARGRAWLAWLVGGATADGIGTWSMHYTGMLAFRLPVPVQYDWPTVLLSLLGGHAWFCRGAVGREPQQNRMASGLGRQHLHGRRGNLGPALHRHGGDAAARNAPLFSRARDPFGRAGDRDFFDGPVADLSFSGRHPRSPLAKPRERAAEGGGQPRHALHRNGRCHLYVHPRGPGLIPRREHLVPRYPWD